MAQTDKMSLKAFWDAVEERLAACSAEELRAILRAMAQQTDPSKRRKFLAKLKAPEEPAAVAASRVIAQEDLLADIEDLAEELEEAMADAIPWEERYEWDDIYGDEDSFEPYEEFLNPLAELFDRVDAAFDYGELTLARGAYEGLFDLLGVEEEYGYGIEASFLPGVYIREAAARYLRAVYEMAPRARRPQALFGHLRQVQKFWFPALPTLDDVVQISPRPLPDWEQFLEDWIAYLRTQSAPSGSDVDLWLREAVRFAEGAAGLEAMARAEGATRPRAYLDWFTVLEEEGKYQEVLAAAQEALQTLSEELPIRAAIADHLCTAAAHVDDAEALRTGRWEAFTAKPTLARLLDLWEVTEDATERTTLMQRAVTHMRANQGQAQPSFISSFDSDWPHDGLERPADISTENITHTYLLAGDWDIAQRLAAKAKVLGWSSNQSHQGLVLAAFLVLLSGEALEALPANLAQVWEWRIQYSAPGWSLYYDQEEPFLLDRLNHAYAAHFATAKMSERQQERFLAWCLDVAQQRVDAIVSNQHRKSYDKAAVLTVACAETLRLRGDEAAANALVDEVRGRYPRHSAFQRAMRAALAAAGLK